MHASTLLIIPLLVLIVPCTEAYRNATEQEIQNLFDGRKMCTKFKTFYTFCSSSYSPKYKSSCLSSLSDSIQKKIGYEIKRHDKKLLKCFLFRIVKD